MSSSAVMPVLFFDFDNTITQGDVLDKVIEHYSVTDTWREWEAAWQEGRISSLECLRRQIADLRVAPGELLKFIADVPIDPDFARIVDWATVNDSEIKIVSDSFSVLIRNILARHGLGELPIYANELTFAGDRPEPHFPLSDVACSSCAHCKAQHLRRFAGRTRIYVGDGLSDVCPALIADVVFAKDSLAAELTRRGLAYRRFRSLADVLRYLHCEYGGHSVRSKDRLITASAAR